MKCPTEAEVSGKENQPHEGCSDDAHENVPALVEVFRQFPGAESMYCAQENQSQVVEERWKERV